MQLHRSFSVFLLVVTAIFYCPSKLWAEPIFKVVDEQGRVTYTDSPPANNKTEELKLPPINTQPATLIPKPRAKRDNQAPTQQTANLPYQLSRIVQPEQDATVPIGQLDVVIQIALQPRLQQGDRVMLYHNGKPQGKAVAATSFSLTDLIRGQHTVRAEIVGSDKRIKAKTQTVTFHVKRYFPRKK